LNKWLFPIIAVSFLVLVGSQNAFAVIPVSPFSDEYIIVAENVPGSKIFYVPSNFDGTFGTPTFMTELEKRIGTGIGDFDNDGDLDFVASTRQSICPIAGVCGSYYFFENTGGGNFVQTLIEEDVPAGAVLIDNYPSDIAIADFNEDGFNDFVSGVYRSDFVYLFTNNQDNTFTRSSLQSIPNPTDAKAGDFNEDGHMDFVITEYFASSVFLYEGDGTGAFTKQFLFTVAGPRAASLAVGDFNEDGHRDIIVDSLQDGTARMFLGDGNGNFAFDSIVYVRPSHTNLDSFDFDKDGHLDIVLSDWDGFVGNAYFKKGNGDGTFQPETLVASSLSTFLTVSAPTMPFMPDDQLVGGELIPIETTSLLLAGAQMTASWLIPVIVAGAGILLVLVRKSENS